MKLRARVVLTLVLIAFPLLWLRAHAVAEQELDALYSSMRWFGSSMEDRSSRSDGRLAGPLGDGRHPRPSRPERPVEPGRMPPAPGVRLNRNGELRRYHVFSLDLAPLRPFAAVLPPELVGRLGDAKGPVHAKGRRKPAGESGPVYAYFTAERHAEPDGSESWIVVEHYSRAQIGRTIEHVHDVLPDVGLVLLAALLALGPLVRRIRDLTEAVTRAEPGKRLGLDLGKRDEISRLARAFEDTREVALQNLATAQKRESALRNFVDNTTHDVAVPLSTLQGHLSTLGSSATESGMSPGDAVAGAQRDAEYIASLVGNLASAARLEASRDAIRFATVDLSALLVRVGLRHQSFGATQGVAVDWGVPDESVLVSGDATLLEQALGNLVQNAIRHGASGGHVALLLDSSPGRFKLVVLDDGPGVEESALEFLDKRHYRSDAARGRHPSGRGLGLAITQDILERHGLAWRWGNRPQGGFVTTITGDALDPEG